jgi:hypothetical protein
MEWLYVGVVAGSIVASGHPTREACEGRRVIIQQQHKVDGICVMVPGHSLGSAIIGPTWQGNTLVYPNQAN